MRGTEFQAKNSSHVIKSEEKFNTRTSATLDRPLVYGMSFNSIGIFRCPSANSVLLLMASDLCLRDLSLQNVIAFTENATPYHKRLSPVALRTSLALLPQPVIKFEPWMTTTNFLILDSWVTEIQNGKNSNRPVSTSVKNAYLLSSDVQVRIKLLLARLTNQLISPPMSIMLHKSHKILNNNMNN